MELTFAPNPSTSSNQNLERVAIEDGLLDAYCRLSFPNLGTNVSSPGINRPLSITFQIKDRWRDDKLVTTAMRALLMTHFGGMRDDVTMRRSGLEAYQQALLLTNRSLQDPRASRADGVLAACKLLALYEHLAGSGFNWERHTLGVNRLLSVRGPLKHTDGVGHSMFLDSRHSAMITAIIRRQHTFLSEPDWKRLPWAKHPKDFRQELIDIMLDLPEVLAELDTAKAMKQANQDPTEQLQRLLDHCQALLEEAHAWYDRFIDSIVPELRDRFREGISQSLSFKHFGTAHTMTLYWTCCLHLENTMRLGLRLAPEEQIPVLAESAQPGNTDAFAFRIARSSKFFLQPNAGTHAASLFSFPMGAAMIHFAFSQRTLTPELKQLYGELRDQSPKFMAKFLNTLQSNDDPWRKSNQDENPDNSYPSLKHRAEKWFKEGKRTG